MPETEQLYVVVTNEEEQFSIWQASRELPSGWEVARGAAAKEDCLAFIEATWTDMRPVSVRSLDRGENT